MGTPVELFRALAVLFEPPGPRHRAIARALELEGEPSDLIYTETFLFQLCPYASVYLGMEGMLGGEARDRVAGFYRVLGVAPPSDPDHLSVLLALYANLAEQEIAVKESQGKQALGRARRAFFWEHVVSWLPPYLDQLTRIAPPFYRSIGVLLKEVLRQEALALSLPLPLPLALREAAPVADPTSATLDSLLDSLLAPVRSGVILTRSDLGRAAKDLGIGLRAGERRFVLKSMLAQEPEAVLLWLAANARDWQTIHEARDYAEPVERFWAERAQRTATALSEFATLARESRVADAAGFPGG